MKKNMTEKETFSYLVGRLYKECQNSRGYLGVEYDNFEVHEGETTVTVLFEKIFDEMVALGDSNIHEQIEDEYDIENGEEKPFKTEKNVIQHINRLRKFVKKYAPKVLDEETAKEYIEQSDTY